MVQTINFSQAQQLTLAYLDNWLNQLPVSQRSAPTIIFDNRAWSVASMKAQVQMGTQVGKQYINYYVTSLKQYVIQ